MSANQNAVTVSVPRLHVKRLNARFMRHNRLGPVTAPVARKRIEVEADLARSKQIEDISRASISSVVESADGGGFNKAVKLGAWRGLGMGSK